MLERFLWIVSDESYYEDANTKQHLPSLDWFQANKYEPQTIFWNHLLTAVRKILVETCSFYNQMCSHLKQNSKQKTKERNSKKMLVEQDKWVEIDELVAATHEEYKKVMELEECSRMFSTPSSRCRSTHNTQGKTSSGFVEHSCYAFQLFAPH